MDIDYVITWVDGQDPAHKAARRRWLAADKARAGGRETDKDQLSFGFDKATQIRFQDNGELYYNIASVLTYAPFIRRIYIVSDDQTPPLLDSFAAEGKCAADFIQLVSHDAIFAPEPDLPQLKAARPSFNSLSIEAALWRIPGLAEHFIFSNDDFFLNAPAQAADFFRADGHPRLCGQWESGLKFILRQYCRRLFGWRRQSPPAPGHSLSLWLAARLAGFAKRYFAVPHCPHPLRKSVFAGYFQRNPQILNRQLSFRFRSAEQFNPVSLANHLEIAAGAPTAAEAPVAYLDNIKSPQHLADFLHLLDAPAGALYGCIQDMSIYPAAAQAGLHRALLKKFDAALPNAIKEHFAAVIAAADNEREPA